MGDVAGRVDRYVGERIRARRAALGLTQHDLANALGLSYQQVQKYETGGNRVSVGRLYEIAARLDVPIDYFVEGFGRGDDGPQGAPRPHGGGQRALIDLVQNFNAVRNARARTALSGLLKSLASWPPARNNP